MLNPLLDGPKARPARFMVRLTHDVRLPKPTFHIKTSRHYLDGKSEGLPMKVGCPPKGQPLGSPSRVPSPLVGCPLIYDKFAMDEWIKAGNTQKVD